MPRPPRFTIRAASALTGINENTLRAWERRYGLISPERTAKGYRLYSDEDIARLRLIQRAMRGGIPVGRVRAYLQTRGAVEHLRDGVETPASAAVGLTADETPLTECCARIEEAARRLDRTALERAYHDSVGLHSVREAFRQALGPALMGLCPSGCGDGCGATQSFLTRFARERLEQVLAGLRPLHQQPRALFACAPGETQEVTLMLLSLEVGLEGVSARYLGAGATPETLQELAGTAGSRAVVLSATSDLPRDAVLGLRERLAGLPRRPRLLLEGRAALAQRDWLEANGVEPLAPAPEEAVRQVVRAADAA
jgi:DNA-binding transcriptional MerR regulator